MGLRPRGRAQTDIDTGQEIGQMQPAGAGTPEVAPGLAGPTAAGGAMPAAGPAGAPAA